MTDWYRCPTCNGGGLVAVEPDPITGKRPKGFAGTQATHSRSSPGPPGETAPMWTLQGGRIFCADTSVQASAAPWLVGSLHGSSVRLVTGPTLPIGWVRTG